MENRDALETVMNAVPTTTKPTEHWVEVLEAAACHAGRSKITRRCSTTA
jgi:hypothetical protein